MIRHIQSCSSAQVEYKVRDQLANISVLEQEAVEPRFDDARRVTESSSDSKVTAGIWTEVNQSIDKALRSSATQTAVKIAG